MTALKLADPGPVENVRGPTKVELEHAIQQLAALLLAIDWTITHRVECAGEEEQDFATGALVQVARDLANGLSKRI